MKRFMLKLVYISTVTLLLLPPVIAYSDENGYATLFAGASFQENANLKIKGYDGNESEAKFDPGYSYGLSVGHDFGRYRMEGEIAFSENAVDSVTTNGRRETDVNGTSRLWAFLFNVHYDFVQGDRFNPYLSAGIGRGNLTSTDGSLTLHDPVWVYNLGAGLNIALTDTVGLDLRYRWLNAEDAEYTVNGVEESVSYASHSALIGVKYKF